MGYLAQKTRASALTIGGQDYTANFISLQVSDISAFKNGLITTSGTLVLGQRPGGVDIEDYDRNLFKRGTPVTLDIQEPGGASYRHPRGHLYVLTLAYDIEAEQLEIEVGCRLSLASLTDNIGEILPLVPIPLDPAQQTIENCSASFASAGMVLYQDNQGNLQSRTFFGADGTGGVEAGDFVSVLGETTLSVSPLSGGAAIPDVINLSYQVPLQTLASDEPIKQVSDTAISEYFIEYPAITYTRVADTEIGEACLPAKDPVTTDSCGGGVTPPHNELGNVGEQEDVLCECEWTSERASVFLPVVKTTTTLTSYAGPAGQTSYQESVEYGPIIEANSQFFADQYAYCSRLYGYSCTPNGGCRYEGLDTDVLSKRMVTYTYDQVDNSLKQTITETYRTKLSAAIPANWRSGVDNGSTGSGARGATVQDFDQNFAKNNKDLFRDTVVIVDYSKENNVNKQVTTTYRSATSSGIVSGIRLDAYNGVKTVDTRLSATVVVNDVKPDSTASPTTQTAERSTQILLNTDSYVTPPAEAATFELQESIPVPLLSKDTDQIDVWVEAYSQYLYRFVRGDLYGLQIGETMRSEIVNGWYPGRPFRYADTQNNTIAAMRMDACSWGVTSEEAIVVMNGVWNGFSSGTLSLGSNLVGNSTPDMGSLVPNPKPSGITSASVSATGGGYVDGTYTGVSLTSAEEITSGSILSSGSGYADGTYTGVSLTSGSGAGATATVQVVGGAVTSVVITDKGQGYTAGDTLSALDTDLGGLGGAGFSYTVDTVGSGTGAVATIQVVNGEVTNVVITDSGQDYAVGDTLSATDASLGGAGGGGFAYTVNTVDERQTVPDAPTAPPGPEAPPSVTNDVVGQSFAFNVEVNLYLESGMFFYGADGISAPNPTFPETYLADMTLVPFVGGIVVEAGGLLETDGTGGIPLDNGGLLVTETATVVDPNLFSA